MIASGGVSVGPHDHVKGALRELGVTERFWGVALRPGKPTWFGTRADVLAFGLPGNPVSAMVTFQLFVRPALAALQGADPTARRAPATLDEAVARNPRREQAVRVRLRHADDGLHAVTTGEQGSHMLTSMLGADALALVAAGRGRALGRRAGRGDAAVRPRDPRRLLERRRLARARVKILHVPVSEYAPDGAIGSKQAAELTLPREELERVWSPVYLERLARTYWSFITRFSLGVLRVVYGDSSREVVVLTKPFVLLRFRKPEYETNADGRGGELADREGPARGARRARPRLSAPVGAAATPRRAATRSPPRSHPRSSTSTR